MTAILSISVHSDREKVKRRSPVTKDQKSGFILSFESFSTPIHLPIYIYPEHIEQDVNNLEPKLMEGETNSAG